MGLREKWTELHQNSANDTVFMTWEWVTVWWEHFGHDKKLWLFQAYTPEGRLVGIAPMVVLKAGKTRLTQWKTLTFIGGTDPVDHLDFIIERGLEPQVLPAFLEAIRKHHQWEVLRISHIPPYSPNLSLLRASHIPWEEGQPDVAPYITLNVDWDTYYASLSKRFRQTQRRAINGLDQTYPNRWSIDVVSKPEDVHPTMLRMMELHQARWTARHEAGSFASEQLVKFYLTSAQKLFEQGWLRLYRLHVEDKLAGVALYFVYRGRMYAYSSGVDYAIPKVTTHVLDQTAIKDAMQTGLQEYDFLLGDEDYKQDWNSVKRFDCTLLWYTSPRVRLGNSLEETAQKAWGQAKKRLPKPLIQRVMRVVTGGKASVPVAAPSSESSDA